MKMPDAAERKVLIVTTFVSGCISLMPQEWVSGGLLLVTSGLMFLGDRRLKQREKAAMVPPLAAAPPPAS